MIRAALEAVGVGLIQANGTLDTNASLPWPPRRLRPVVAAARLVVRARGPTPVPGDLPAAP
jgi:hypothetical protein